MVIVVTWSSFSVYYNINLPQQQWSLLNRFCMEQGHCSACRRRWRLTDTYLCPCGETQTISHIVKSCPNKTEWNSSKSWPWCWFPKNATIRQTAYESY